MALYRRSHLIRKAIVYSWSLSLKPISVVHNSSRRSYFNENNDDNGCSFNFFKRSFVSGPPNVKFSNSDSSASSYSILSPLHRGPSYMRAAVFWEPNKPLTMEDFQMPRPKANEILIKTKGPCVVGHEITGEVVEHGAFTDSKIIERFPIGGQVVGACMMPCGSCLFCSKGQDDLCESFFAYNLAKGTLYDGETRLYLRDNGKPIYMHSMGGLAEYCVVPAHGLAVLPNSLPYAESAILGCAVFTAYGAMARAAQVCPGDAIAVIGMGGIGSSCLQIARAFGASDFIAVDVQDEKLQKAKTFGATHTINALDEYSVKRIKDITGGMGVDVAVEALGKQQTFMQCVQSVRDAGKAVMLGLALFGTKGEIDINRLVRRQLKATSISRRLLMPSPPSSVGKHSSFYRHQCLLLPASVSPQKKLAIILSSRFKIDYGGSIAVKICVGIEDRTYLIKTNLPP